MSTNSVGRPTKMTAEVVSKLEEAFRFGATISEACYLSCISREMFYQHFRSDLEFSDKIERARSWLAITAKHNLAVAIMNGDTKASVWLIEKRDSLPATTIEEELPQKPEDVWDEDDERMLEAYVRTKEKLRREEDATVQNP